MGSVGGAGGGGRRKARIAFAGFRGVNAPRWLISSHQTHYRGKCCWKEMLRSAPFYSTDTIHIKNLKEVMSFEWL